MMVNKLNFCPYTIGDLANKFLVNMKIILRNNQFLAKTDESLYYSSFITVGKFGTWKGLKQYFRVNN